MITFSQYISEDNKTIDLESLKVFKTSKSFRDDFQHTEELIKTAIQKMIADKYVPGKTNSMTYQNIVSAITDCFESLYIMSSHIVDLDSHIQTNIQKSIKEYKEAVDKLKYTAKRELNLTFR